MDKPLIKLYAFILAALAISILFIPVIVRRVSNAATDAITGLELSEYNDKKTMPTDNGRGNAVIIMDDGWETQYTRGFQILKQYNMKADIAVVPTLVDKEGYMSYSQLANLYTNGWDMLNHTYDHVELGGLSEQEQQYEIEKGQDWIKGHKLTRESNILIYPNGSYTGLTIQILKKEKIEAARSLNSIWVSRTGSSLENTDICNLYSYILIDRVQEAIDKAVNNNGTVIIMLHKIEPVTDDTNMQIDEDTFKEVISRLSKSGLNVLTLSELLSVKNDAQVNN